MANVSGGLLAATTCRAGGLGFIAAGHLSSLDDLTREIDIFQDDTNGDAPLCLGFIGHSAMKDIDAWKRLEQALETHRPSVVQFFAPAIVMRHGAQESNVQLAQRYGAKVMAQVSSVSEARQALSAGVDAIIAQGSEAGGHGIRRDLGNGTLALAARVVSISGSIPVIAAGGIVDGRGLVSALALGCDGVVLGTRLWASKESLGHDSFKVRLVAADSGDEVIRTTCVDQIVNNYSTMPWPKPYDSVGMLRNQTSLQWDSKESELQAAMMADALLATDYKAAVCNGNHTIAAVLCGEGVGDIDAIESVHDIIYRIDQEAREIIATMPKMIH